MSRSSSSDRIQCLGQIAEKIEHLAADKGEA
jgi:hypothetical protein